MSTRRQFLLGATAIGLAGEASCEVATGRSLSVDGTSETPDEQGSSPVGSCAFNSSYRDENLSRIGFPLGGIGAGMMCLEGTGALTRFSLRHAPDLANEPLVFAALSLKGSKAAKVLEGALPAHKRYAVYTDAFHMRHQTQWSLPRFRSATFEARFPFARIELVDDAMPLAVKITGWSPFDPGNEDDASLPVAALEYEFTNPTTAAIEAVFSFHAANFLSDAQGQGRIRSVPGGFLLEGALKDKPWTAGAVAVSTEESAVRINHAWFRGAGTQWLLWRDIEEGACYDRAPIPESDERSAPGASLFIPFSLPPGQSKRITLQLAWYVRQSNLKLSGGGLPDFQGARRQSSVSPQPPEECYQAWYTGRFSSADEVMTFWRERYEELRERSWRFSQALYSSTLPAEVLEAVTTNLTILKSPTVLRQADGRFWAWEGSSDTVGNCDGSCTHVWNYAQALAHLFPRLERMLRETEFGINQNAEGHQAFRTALPIRPALHTFHAAADGQLGGILKTYRDWRISGDSAWLAGLWPKIRASLDYCIRTWDPRHVGWLEEPHHNTYDIEFWGPDSMTCSFYLGALKAVTLIGAALHEDVDDYAELLQKGIRRMESKLFNGEYFNQKVIWQGLKARYPEDALKAMYAPSFPEERELAAREGPQNQYGAGCLSDGVLGAWLAWACGLGRVLDEGKIASHLRAVHRYNFKPDLTDFAGVAAFTVHSTFALGSEGGLVLCTWPRGGKPSIPFPYASVVFTGIEYQVASHLIAHCQVEQGLDIVRACRLRYDGRVRNPFDEVEAGHWYARALSSYALLQAFSGARYDAVEKVLYLKPAIQGDFRCFLATAAGYGVVGVRDGTPFVEVAAGEIPYQRIDYTPR